MNRNSKLFSILILTVFLFTVVAPQPAHAGFLGSIVSSVTGAVSGAVSSVTGAVSSAVGGVVNAVKGGVSSVVGAVTGAVGGVVNAVKGGVSGVMGAISGGISSVGDALKGAFGSVVEAGKQIYETVKESVKNVVGTITSSLPKIGDLVKDTVGGVAQSAVDTVAKGAGAVAGGTDALAGLLSKLPSDIAAKVKGGIDNVKDYISGKVKDAKEFAGMVKEFGINLFDEAKKDATAATGKVAELIGKGAALVNPVVADLANFQISMAEKAAGKALDVAKFINEKAAAAPGFLKQLTDGAAGLFSKGADALNKASGDAAEIIGKNLATLSSLRSDPLKYSETFGKMFDVTSTSGNATATAAMSFGGFKLSTGADILGAANNDISKHEALLKAEAWLGPKLETGVSASYLGGKGNFSLDNRLVAGLDAQAEGNVKWLKDGAVLDAKGDVNLVAGLHNTTTLTNDIQLGKNVGLNTSAVVDVVAGAQATANGSAYLGKNGVELQGGAEARVGLWADASGSQSVQYKGQNLFTAEGTAGAGLGVGAGANGGFSLRADKVGFSANITLGPVKLGGGIYVNPVAVGQMAWDGAKNVANKVSDGAKNLVSKLKFW